VSASDPANAETSEPAEPIEPSTPRYGRPRRAPRYGSFVFTGVVVGVVLALIVSFGRPATGQFSQNSVIGYVAAIFALTGALVGAAAAVFFDRRRPQPPAPQGQRRDRH
jgi:membrane associated rhomboid family serine protease